MSLYNDLPERGYAIRIWPARFPANPEKYGTKLAPYITNLLEQGADTGHAVDPLRFDDEDLTERELSYGRSGFALQFMLDTSLSDADKYPLRLRDFITMDLDHNQGPTELVWAADPDRAVNVPAVGLAGDRYYYPMIQPKEFAEYTGSVMFIDPSGRGKDETAWAIVNMLHGRLFVMDCAGHRGGYDDELLKRILRTAKQYRVNKILVEPNFGDGMFAKLLGAHRVNIYDVTIEDAPWSKMMKEQRIIDTLEPVMNQHRVVIDRGLVERDYNSTSAYAAEDQNRYRLAYQLTRITREKGALVRDDRLDALAGAVAYWLEHMGRNEAVAAREHKEHLLDQELRKIIEYGQGRKVDRKTPTLQGIRALKDVR